MLYAFACARRGKNDVQKPSWTHSGGQDGVFRGANTGRAGPKRGPNLPIPGPKTEGMQNQRTKAQKKGAQLVQNRRHRDEARKSVYFVTAAYGRPRAWRNKSAKM